MRESQKVRSKCTCVSLLLGFAAEFPSLSHNCSVACNEFLGEIGRELYSRLLQTKMVVIEVGE